MQLLTDRELYHSKEQLDMELSIDCNEGGPVFLAVTGIEISGRPKLYQVQKINLTKGSNIVKMGYTLPSCNSCSGLSPGNYSVRAEVYFNNSIVESAEKQIRLEQ